MRKKQRASPQRLTQAEGEYRLLPGHMHYSHLRVGHYMPCSGRRRHGKLGNVVSVAVQARMHSGYTVGGQWPGRANCTAGSTVNAQIIVHKHEHDIGEERGKCKVGMRATGGSVRRVRHAALQPRSRRATRIKKDLATSIRAEIGAV